MRDFCNRCGELILTDIDHPDHCPAFLRPVPLEWNLSGYEWQACPRRGLMFVVMSHEGRWIPYVFEGVQFKRGKCLSQEGLADLEAAKQVAQDFYNQDQL